MTTISTRQKPFDKDVYFNFNITTKWEIRCRGHNNYKRFQILSLRIINTIRQIACDSYPDVLYRVHAKNVTFQRLSLNGE